MSSTSQPPTKKGQYNIGHVLYRQLEAGENIDVVFLLGQNGQTRLKAHKNVLMGVSDVFSSKLSERWGQDDKELNGMGIIELDENVTVKAATAFIKAMYLGAVDDDLTLDHLLEMIGLCEQFLAQELITVCSDGVVKLMAADNCVKIFEKCHPLDGCQHTVDQSLLCLKKNLLNILSNSSHPSSQWSAETWRQVLLMEGEEMKDDWEKTIFLELIRWRETSDIDEPEFRQLLNLVRFPRMDAKTIASVVDQKNVLSDKEVLDLLCYVAGGGLLGKRMPAFNFEPRSKKTASNSDELLQLLNSAQPGDFIQLVGAEYVGPFRLSVDKVTIKGVGEATKLIARNANDIIFRGFTSDSNVSNISFEFPMSRHETSTGFTIIGSRNVVSNVTFKNCLLAAIGNHSRIEKLSFDGGKYGLLIFGLDNNFSNVALQNLELGIYVCGENTSSNIIQNVAFGNVRHGVYLGSDNNVVSHITYKWPVRKGILPSFVIAIVGSCGNVVDNVTIIHVNNQLPGDLGKDKDEKLWSICVKALREKAPTYNKLANFGVGEHVLVEGERNWLKNVNECKTIDISGSGHRLEDCTVQKIINNGAVNVELTGCDFKL